LLNTAVAIELYLKCLSNEVVCRCGRGWSKVSSSPERGCAQPALSERVEGDLRDELDRAVQIQLVPSVAVCFGLRLNKCEGAFETARQPFEQGHTHQRFRWSFS
ncbi:MAG: hypothetical protein ABSG65_29845, partial [Bryobacteraceae bacterium]